MSQKFLDEITLNIKAGNGGAGCIAFRREKYVPRGGPDGGDGGKGGDVYIAAFENILSFSHLNEDRSYHASNGRFGQGQLKSGKGGKDILIKVPIGTQLLDPETGDIINDFVDTVPFLLAKGGRGGKGNAFFKTATKQAPDYAQPGEETEERQYFFILKLIADAGMVGLPNAGKSSLLKAITGANPKIAPYPFTTLTPNLGVLYYEQREKIVLADIPGIIEGASEGHGLALSFLRHIERVKTILYILDIHEGDPLETLHLLQAELTSYNEDLVNKSAIIVLNKIDQIEDRSFLKEWEDLIRKESKLQVTSISAQTGEGIDTLIDLLFNLVSNEKQNT